MNKHDLFIAACKAERWKWRAWRISLFAMTTLPADHQSEDYDIDYAKDGVKYYDPEKGWELIEGAAKDEPLFLAAEPFTAVAGDIPTITKDTETTYGRMLFNWLVVHYAFGTKLPYQQKVMPNDIVKKFISKVIDEPEDGTLVLDDSTFYPSEIERFVTALFELTSLCPYITPTGSVKTLTTHPDMVKVRDALLLKYKDQLDDPAVITMIQNELIELDKEWLKGDSAEGYYISSKSFSVKRKKMFVMHGIEASFKEDGSFDLIPTSLSEGWDMTKLVAKYNATREGSHDRGHDTALGGEKVTFLQRIFQNIKVVEGDCGTKLTHKVLLTKDMAKRYMGMNIMDGGKLVELNNDNVEDYLGKVVALRRPILCKMPLTDFCSACTTAALAKNPRAVAAMIAAVGSAIMAAFMASMHGTELAVSHYDYRKHIS